jgi:hypothetical protein
LQKHADPFQETTGARMGSPSAPPRRRPQPQRETETGGDPGGVGDPCDISLSTFLDAPRSDVLPTLRKGDELDVAVRSQGSIVVAVCITRNSLRLAGTLPTDLAGPIITCIQSQVKFVATVLQVAGGLCEVKVFRA